MADDQREVGESFTVGRGSSWRATAEDLARSEAMLSECQARLDELSAKVTALPVEPCDPRRRTLPEQLAGYERSYAEAQAGVAEAGSLLRACDAALDGARPGSDDVRARLEDERRVAQDRVTRAEKVAEGCRRRLEEARERLPEDDEAEAHARIADAELDVQLLEGVVDSHRADLLPERVRDALELLAAHATDEWLYRHGPQEPERRNVIRHSVLATIQLQLARVMFRPELTGLDMVINLTGSPEPKPRLSDAPDPESTDPAEQLAATLNHLRFGTGE